MSTQKDMVGGTHYAGLKIDPVTYSMMNRWDAAAFSVLKYLTRHRTKNGLEDLLKARHFVLIRERLAAHRMTGVRAVEMAEYITVNEIDNVGDMAALHALESYVRWPMLSAEGLLLCIDNLIAEARNLALASA